jgi:hypothetical protein
MNHDKLSSERQHTENVEKISNSSGELEAQNLELEEKEAARVLRKVDMRLVPILTLLYLVAFIDRSNSTYTPMSTSGHLRSMLLTKGSR